MWGSHLSYLIHIWKAEDKLVSFKEVRKISTKKEEENFKLLEIIHFNLL